MSKILKHKFLIIPLILILAGSFLGGLFNTSFYSVDVSNISFVTERGTLTGLLYMPEGAGPNNPRPVIVTTHGYLNTGEMQDAVAVEMSRRGFIVLAMDMYDHGNSRWDADIPVGAQFLTFWIHAQFNAVQWAYNQPWALRDAQGNGMIAVSGHSMGGFSSTVAMYFDELQSLQSGVRMIYAGISVGADLSHSANLTGTPVDQLLAGYGNRPVGFVAGLYDEFFFNAPAAVAAAGGSVQRSDWTQVPVGQMFLGLDPEGEGGNPNQWYWAQSGELVLDDNVVRESQQGLRIVFTPNEIHPWNHFSATTTAYIINFFDTAMGHPSPLPSSNQIWQWKVFFNFIALIGYFMLVVPLAGLLLKLPFFKLAITEKVAPVPAGMGGMAVIAISALLPAALVTMLMERRAAELHMFGLMALILAVVALIQGIFFLVRAKDNSDGKFKVFGIGGIVVAAISFIIWLIAGNPDNVVALSPYFMAPAVNTIAYWAVMSGVVTFLIIAILYFFFKKPMGASLANYGLVPKVQAIVAGLVTAICTVVLLYVLLFVMEMIFMVDARVFTLAIRTFTFEHVLAALRYMPVFLVFYFFNTVAITANAQGRKGGIAIAIVINIGGLALWLAMQYMTLFSTGVAWYPTMALNAILLFALTPCLGIAAVYAYKLYQKTNNVYLASFVNTIFFTMIVVANTAVFWNMVPAA